MYIIETFLNELRSKIFLLIKECDQTFWYFVRFLKKFACQKEGLKLHMVCLSQPGSKYVSDEIMENYDS